MGLKYLKQISYLLRDPNSTTTVIIRQFLSLSNDRWDKFKNEKTKKGEKGRKRKKGIDHLL